MPAPPRPTLPTALLAVSLGLPLGTRAQDLTELPLEQLLDTEVVGTARFARQVTDAASAVSVLTAQDIRDLGLHTLAQVLDQMRGLHLSADSSYIYLGSRGIGGPGSYAGRVLMLVDGIPAADNLFDQIFLGHDGLLDPALIERIEYAPGAGSAMYGNNAFLGVINIVTLRGRDLGGAQVAAFVGQHGDRQARLSWGRREPGDAEWLASVTVHRDDGMTTGPQDALPQDSRGEAANLLLKGRWGDLSLQALAHQRTVRSDYRVAFRGTEQYTDGGQVVSLEYDRPLEQGWRTLWRAQWGGQHYRYRLGAPEVDYLATIRANGHWWNLESQAGLETGQHRLILGARLRGDPVLRYTMTETGSAEAPSAMRRHSLSLSVEDEWRLTPDWALTTGVRADRRSHVDWTASPRAALVWWALPQWQFKASIGRATRFASAAEDGFGGAPRDHGEQVLHRELATEYRQDRLRLQASVYRFRIGQLLWPAEGVDQLSGHGSELEAEWQGQGLRLRGSVTRQDSQDNLGRTLDHAPHLITKLMASVPLAGERWRLSGSVRHTGRSTAAPGGTGGVLAAGSRSDLTLRGQRVLGGLDLVLGWRQGSVTAEPLDSSGMVADSPSGPKTHSVWIGLQGDFR